MEKELWKSSPEAGAGRHAGLILLTSSDSDQKQALMDITKHTIKIPKMELGLRSVLLQPKDKLTQGL